MFVIKQIKCGNLVERERERERERKRERKQNNQPKTKTKNKLIRNGKYTDNLLWNFIVYSAKSIIPENMYTRVCLNMRKC